MQDFDIFKKIKNDLLKLDPIYFAENYLTIDGKPFDFKKSGYKPFTDIYRYIGIKALEPDSKPVVFVASRQIGKSTTLNVLELYFMGCGYFGLFGKAPMRVIHAFPRLDFVFSYSKTKLNPMISASAAIYDPTGQPQGNNATSKKVSKSYMENLLDPTSPTNNSLQFKQFIGGNHLWIESLGIDGGRMRGKQLCLDTELPTPNGFIKLRDLREGDQLFDEQGNICNVVKLHPINETPEAYRLTFNDDTVVDACADHLWLTYTREDRKRGYKSKVKNTREIFDTQNTKNSLANHSILISKAVKYSEKQLPIDPYLLGVWEGDGDRTKGTISCTDNDIEILSHIKMKLVKYEYNTSSEKNKCFRYRVGELLDKNNTDKILLEGGGKSISEFTLLLKNNNLLNNKHIPIEYLTASFEQRMELLRGLMDTDGCVGKTGKCSFTSTIKQLAYDFLQLVSSLGIKASIRYRDRKRKGVENKRSYEIFFTTTLPIFKIYRKLNRIKKSYDKRNQHRYITKVEPIDPKPMRCITVDSPSHLFLVTRSFIPTHNTADAMFVDEVQDATGAAIINSIKVLNKARYGKIGEGIQVYTGTPKQKGSEFWKLWQQSSQQYYYLGCEKCEKHFALHTPGSDEWENIWLYGQIVRCPHCGFEQDKREAIDRGKWIAANPDVDCKYTGFHINQLYMPEITKEKILDEKPGPLSINTERSYQNEVLGEFYHGEATIITADQIRELCGDTERKFAASITNAEENITFLGMDIGAKNDLEQLVDSKRVKAAGISYSTAVVLSLIGQNKLSIQFCAKFKKNDFESKKSFTEQLMRQYSIKTAICDIGYANDFNETMQNHFGNRFLSSQASGKVNNHIKYSEDVFPKIITFERDFYIAELFDQMKKGNIRFPMGDYEQIAWLIEHCTSMEIKPSISRYGDVSPHYIKGSSPNDGFMALLNAYIAYKFFISNGFKNNFNEKDNFNNRNKPMVLSGYMPRL